MTATQSMLIRDAELLNGERLDVRIREGRLVAIGELTASPGEPCIEARGGLLIPGLHDHHLHLAATAAAYSSVRCGPPDVLDQEMLAQALSKPAQGWVRGLGYHESVAGMLERSWLDKVTGHRPVRVQHRGGRMWFLNSAAIDALLTDGTEAPAGLDIRTGQLFDEDVWLRAALRSAPPPLEAISLDLARHGITGITDMSVANMAVDHAHIRAEQRRGALLQRVVLAGTPQLSALDYDARLSLGPVKLHLHEGHLPPYDWTVRSITAAHDAGRGVAVHCVTETELVFALAAMAEAGCSPDDRIEHASITTDGLLDQIRALGLCVVTQPSFVAERGDAYLRDVAADDWPHLYRLRAFLNAGVALAGSSDAPYVGFDPWAGMAAAVSRRTASGAVLGDREALDPAQALALYLADPLDIRRSRAVQLGMSADLCLLKAGWVALRDDLKTDHVCLTIIDGAIVHDARHTRP